ncbi:ABC transporter permease [Christensenellaceae bacterium OttesenSCG-928-M15]|nr:ABC transporter permease [Christensenellaceae bacterium OttesenSCG-928-M15]
MTNAATAKAGKIKKSSLTKRSIEKFMHNKLAILGLVILTIMILACVCAPLLTKYDPTAISLTDRVQPPGGEHIFGTDKIGRDIFSRVLYGGRISMLVGLAGALGGMVIGVLLGSLCGYFGGWLDSIFVKLGEIVLVVPQLPLIMVLVAIIGQGTQNLILVFAFTGWVATFRLVRGRFFSLREESFVEACRAFGISNMSIAFRHILPNCLGPVVVQLTLNTASFILQEAALSFIGMGVPSGTPTWGNIMNSAKEIMVITTYPWIWIPTGIAIALFVLGVNFFGDGLRDALDPKQM